MEVSKDYIKGFNSGYIVRKNHPLLMKKLLKGVKGNSELVQGLKAGVSQFEKEVAININQFKQGTRSKGQSKGSNLEF
tara:strand:- start:421642 stop:421875 length:234 start_codon:yes stop_codon:yes gene_type:complete